MPADIAGQNAGQSLNTPENGIQKFQFSEDGDGGINVSLQGGLMPEIGSTLATKQKGGKYIPLGSVGGSTTILTALSLDFDDTEMTIYADAPFMRPGDCSVSGVDFTYTPEGLVAAFVAVQRRARICNVQIGPFARRGILRDVTPTPGRGYGVDPGSSVGGLAKSFGTNVQIVLRWQWQGEGVALALGKSTPTAQELAGALSAASAGFGGALTDLDALDGNLLSQLSDGIGKINAGITGLRGNLKAIGDMAKAPAKLANQALATARGLGNVLHDFDTTLHDTADEYGMVGTNYANLLKSKRTKGQLSNAMNDAMAATLAVIDALESRRRKVVGVHPGQNLAEIAKRELGSADRWTEIASVNEIAGQLVPPGTFQVEIPPKG